MSENNYTGLEIAVIGMAGRFPGAKDIDIFWDNLKKGIESVSFFSDRELREEGVREELLQNPDYIKAMGYLEGLEEFDANFFDYAPMEAEVLEPQVRLFHEGAWEALENAGYVPDTYDGLIGLYAGASDSFNWKSLAILSGKAETLGQFEVDQLTNKDQLCSRVAYKLNLRGPVVFVQTACSTSLVAVHMACQGLLSGETDIALAGGITIIPLKAGYFYQEGMIHSPDGHCRVFENNARGTLPANGLGIVVLKRLEEAVEDGDTIHAVIKGSAINNDGTQKMGFTAPSVEGQLEAVKDALRTAQVEAESIGYLEAHGTGTILGDPVEIEALTLAFNTNKKGFCGIGSVKSNFGHLDSAAGAAGFIKTVLALKHRMLPPSLHFNIPNNKINFINSPFYINADLKPWENENNRFPRRAGVSSLGIGGTNAHVVLEEWSRGEPLCSSNGRDYQFIPLSAKTQYALDRMVINLAEYLKKNPSVNLADAAYTLQVGRKAFKYRWAAICSTLEETIEALEEPQSEVFGGQGTFFQKGSLPPEAIETVQSWLEGQTIDWSELYHETKHKRSRIPLPAYPFERQRFWIDGDLLNLGAEMFLKRSRTGIEKKPNMADWFYIPSWKRTGIPFPQNSMENTLKNSCWLIFIDSCGLGSQLAGQLERDGEYVVRVEAGAAFQKVKERRFILNPERESDYETLFNEITLLRRIPHQIVHLWGVTGEAYSLSNLICFYSLLHIARAISKQGISDELRLTAVTDNMQEVIGGDGRCPEKALVMGPVKVIPTEYPHTRCFSIDVELPPVGTVGEKRLVHQLLEELTSGSRDPVIAYRRGFRWVQVFEPRPFAEPVKGRTYLRREGVYLVTGGLGGIGLALAEILARRVRGAKLVLTGRREMSPGDRPQEIKDLQQLGAEVLVCKADVTDYEQMRQVIDGAEERFGSINGIIHCAGLPDGEMIQRRTTVASERIFQAKVTGTLVLDRLLQEMKPSPDFLILCSSVTSILPMIGQVAYCAANAFLDAFAHYKTMDSFESGHRGTSVLSINWDRWQHVGIAVIAEEQHKKLTGEDMVGGISRDEGMRAFDRILAGGFRDTRVVVSSLDFGMLLEQAYAFNAASMMEGLEDTAAPKTMIRRPELSSEYAAPDPGNSTQEKLACLWGNFFGFQQVGIRDDFFELGGDSLKALVLLPKIHKELDVYIPIAEFFNRPTIRELAEYIHGADKSFYSSVEAVEKKEYYLLSSAQKRLYLLQQMDTDSTGYNIPMVLPVGKDIEKEKLEFAFRELIARHESLRTSFEMVNDVPVQRIHDGVEFEIEYYDLTAKTREGARRIKNFVRPFDLKEAPLIRSGIIKNPDGNYTWFIDVHHIVSDGISQSILTGDFMVLYNGDVLEPLKFQYKDFSRWQNRLFAGDEIKVQEAYWLNLYADAGEISRLSLPVDRPRPEVFTFAGDHYGFNIEKEDAAAFRSLVSGNGGTLFMGILAVLNVLFYKYTGQTDIVIGSGAAGRPRDDFQAIIGMFVNTLVMRNFPQGEKNYTGFLKEVITRSLKAFENQDVQFEELVNKLDLERDPSRNPLFDISMVSLNFSLPKEMEESRFFVDENFSLIDAVYNNPTSRFDMTFFIHEPGEEVYINIEYYTAVYKEETIRRLASHFKAIVRSVVKQPAVKLGDIEIITEEEKRQVLYEFNDTVKDYPKDKSIHELFAEQAGKLPHHTAVVFEDAVITYSELNRRSDSLAVYLYSKGVRREDAVGVMLERSLEMVIGLLGILKAGGAYLPIAPGYPEERKRYMLADSNAKLSITSMSSDDMSPAAKERPAARLAYIMYTSGSTGKPKGVMVEHSNVVRLVKNTGYIQFRETHRLLQNGALEFDISTFEIWGPLLNGSNLVLAGKEALMEAENLKDTLNRYDISILHLIPQLFNGMAHQDPALFKRLAYLLVGGDRVDPGYVEIVRKRCPGVTILHMYGPTENTTFSSFFPVNGSCENSLPIGKPVANSSVYILGGNGEFMPVGVVGEICTGGEGVARGYLNRPELTKETFCLRQKIYKTGDLGRWLPDGNIEFLGRMDRQVKIRGVRIEMEEIAGHLLAKEEIREAVVATVTGGSEARYLCAYIVSNREFDSSDLREMLSGDLPAFMIPSYFVQLDKMPLTASGKIDRKALPDPVLASGSNTPFIAPGDAVEKKVAEIWAIVLGVNAPIGIDDNFFLLGGHSLNAAILVSKIHKELQVKVPLAEVFKKQTVRKLARYIKHAKGTVYTGIHPVEKREYYALSSAQKRLYLIQQMDIKGIGYNMPFILPLGKDIEADTLEAAFNKMIARHESLRTSFEMVKEMPVQRIHNNVEFEIEFYDLTAKTREGTQRIKDFIKPFDLTKAPLIRSGIIKNPDRRYTWIVDMHHIISDGTSQTVFIEDFISFYRDKGGEPELPALPFQYKDFSLWQNRLFESDEIKIQEEYWLNLYWDAGEIPGLNLPVDYKRPAVFTFAGDTYRFKLGREDAVKFKALGSGHGCTLYMNFLAVLNVLFYKYTGREDIIIGSGVAGRQREDLQTVMGMFVNTLAMRNYPKGEKTYVSFLEDVAAHSIKAFENQDVQFEHLVDKLNLERDTSRNPLFDVTMLVQNFKQVQLTKESLPGHDYQYKNTTAKFDMTFFVYEYEEDIYIDVEYYTSIYKEETIRRLASHLKSAVKAVVQQPAVKIKDIEMITEAEKRQVLHEFNDTVSEYPRDKVIHELFEEQADRVPDNIAVTLEDRMITYRELSRGSDNLAAYLHSKGVQREDAVGVMLERSLEMVTGLLGILKAGGAYLPVDSDYPKERIDYMLNDIGTKILVSTGDLFEKKKIVNCQWETGDDVGNRLACSATDSPGISFHHPSFIEKPNHSENLAYIMYTSGSTGKPKGVMVEHGNVVRLVKNTNFIEFKKGDRLLQTGALEFDASTFEIWGTLLNGITLCLIGKEKVLAAGRLKKSMHRYGISTMWMTAPLFNRTVEEDIEIFSGLRNFLVGGDVLSPYHINRLRKRFPGLRVINGYGPTENTTFSTTYVIDREYEENIPIGKPIANSYTYIVDRNGRLAPPGAAGELYVGGDGVARGYLNKPELTKEKFCLRQKIYRTGDLGRWLPDGNIEFLGRMDEQVKIRGFRVELKEIENCLLAQEGIKDAVVTAIKEGPEVTHLCAYIVGSGVFEPSALREILSAGLPLYMIPSYFVPLERIPLTANGKVDRRLLPDPGTLELPDRYTAPRDEFEKKLAAIWSEVLGLDASIGIDDDFFLLGGHSLNAAVLIAKIHKELEVNVPLAEVFKKPTLRKLSQYIKHARGTVYAGIHPVEKREYYALSSAQKRLYFLQQMDLKSTGYNMPFVLPFGKDMEKERLESTFRKLIARHESLRTSFEKVDGEVVQRIHDDVKFEIECYDLASEGFVRPFDLTRAPLIRSGIIKNPEGTYTWLVDLHHIISDGTSQTVLTEDFISLYNCGELEPLRLQYKDFSGWQNGLFERGGIKAQEEYWLQLYANPDELSILSLPADYKRPEVFSFAGETYKFGLDREESLKFKTLGSRSGVTLYMNFLAALNVLFFKYTGQTDMVIGTGIAGRRHADLQQVIGMFVNTLAMRNQPRGEKTYGFFLKEVAAHSIKAFENQDVQFEDLVEKLDLERDPSRNPLFDVTMAVQNFRRPGQGAAGFFNPEEKLPREEFGNPTAKFDMTFFIYETEEDIYIDLEYYSAVFKKETIQRLASHFKNIVKAVAEQPAARLKDIEIITEKEKRQVLYEFNDTAREYPSDKTIHKLFEEQAEKIPDKVAVTFEGSMITYNELGRKADSLAAYFYSKGVQQEDVVGVMLERSLEMVIGLLGILKVGGAYLPIDSDYPEERIKYLLNASGAKILLNIVHFADAINRVPTPDHLRHAPCAMRHANNLAYIIYTSGSTGKPKGVMVEHRNVARLVKNSRYIDYMELKQEDRFLLTGAFSFDITTFEIWGMLLNGIGLYMVEKNVILEAEKLYETVVKNRISIMHFIPPLLNRQVENCPGIFDALGCVLVGGDMVSLAVVNCLRNRYPHLKILHMYGPTENTTFSTFFPVENMYEERLPIGKPIGNSTVYILDRYEGLQPPGVFGELCTGGDGVARGYLNNPELTKEKFLTAKGREGTRRVNMSYMSYFYKTGDLGRWLPDGNIEFWGRIDRQVKVRGFRVELGEIENRLLTYREIKEAVILAQSGELCAYLVSGVELDLPEVRDFLSRELPGYMVPSYFVQLEQMPLTSSGKVDRKALPSPEIRTEGDYTAPRDEVEKKLVKIWSEVLGAADNVKIGIDDNFFRLGGHSLKATMLAAKIHKELHVKIPLADIFKAQTVRGLSEIVRNESVRGFVEIEPTAKREYYQLSFNQKRLWFIQQKNPEDNSYNMPGVMALNEKVDEAIIKRTTGTVIEKHESLRTGFKEVDGEAVQYIIEKGNPGFDLSVKDISTLDEGTKQGELIKVINRFCMEPFRLDEPPLFRCLLIRENDHRYIFAYNMHHIVSDGWSMQILERDFRTIYDAYLNSGNSEYDGGVSFITYKDFARWHNRELVVSVDKRGSRAFWLDFLKDELPLLKLPADFNDKGKAGARFRFVIPENIKDTLKQLSRQHNITLFSLLYSIYNIFLSMVSGQRTVVSGIVNAGRDHPSLRDIVGFFVNSVIFKKTIDKNDVFIDFAGEVHGAVLEFFKHQHYPLEFVLDEAGIKYPEVAVSFNMINVRDNEAVPLENESVGSSHTRNFALQNVKFDIEPYVSEYSNGIEIDVSYNKNRFKAENIEYMMNKYGKLIEFFALNPLQRINEYKYKETGKRKSFKKNRRN